MLEGKNAVVYGGAGAMGGAVARAFAGAGARVFLVGRTEATLASVADDITAAGGTARWAVVDARDPEAVEQHARSVADAAGSLDISFNAVGTDAVQGVPLVDMSLDDFMTPIVQAAQTHFATCTAAARWMTTQGAGVIVTLSSTAACEWRHEMGGFNVACASIEVFSRSLAGEVGPRGVRVVCLRPNFTPETTPQVDVDALGPLIENTQLGRLPTLAQVAGTAVFAASEPRRCDDRGSTQPVLRSPRRLARPRPLKGYGDPGALDVRARCDWLCDVGESERAHARRGSWDLRGRKTFRLGDGWRSTSGVDR